eukprot:6016780-Alexandrium_andersonii.AAC.1
MLASSDIHGRHSGGGAGFCARASVVREDGHGPWRRAGRGPSRALPRRGIRSTGGLRGCHAC